MSSLDVRDIWKAYVAVELSIVSQTNSENARFSAQSTFSPSHLLRDLCYRRAGFRVCLELALVIFRPRRSMSRSFFRHCALSAIAKLQG